MTTPHLNTREPTYHESVFWCYNLISTLTEFTDDLDDTGGGDNMKATDAHHILWYKRSYSKGWAKKLRDHWYCKVEIPRDTLHRQIHYEVAHVPVPRAISIRETLEQLALLEKFGGINRDDPIEKRLLVLMALFDCVEPRTYKALKEQYGVVCKFYNKKAPP